MTRTPPATLCLIGAAVMGVALAMPTPAQADPTTCQETIARQLQKFKKTYLKAHVKCLRLENLGRIGGPCPDQTQDRSDDAVGHGHHRGRVFTG